MTATLYSLGISPCPNDTFIFDALLHQRIPLPFATRLHMADVESLNSLAGEAALDITKLSLYAALRVLDRYAIINSGAALGRGCGPLVVSRPGLAPEALAKARIAIPGRLTTANLLLSLTGRFAGPREEMPFDQVMPALLSQKAELGVIIHEGRFTYAERGLSLVLDLGAWWEEYSGLPLPLGLIAVKRSLGHKAILDIQDAVRRSLEHARTFPEQSKGFIRSHAQEMDEAVMAAHIATFVNDFSLDLRDEGRSAILALLRAAQQEAESSAPSYPLSMESVFAPYVGSAHTRQEALCGNLS